MSKLIFVNLPVADLARATAFYEAIGAKKNEQFCDATASCMVFSETIHAMLLTHDKFRQFTPKGIADARTTSEVLICLSAESRAAVDATVDKAAPAGGKADPALAEMRKEALLAQSEPDPRIHPLGPARVEHGAQR